MEDENKGHFLLNMQPIIDISKPVKFSFCTNGEFTDFESLPNNGGLFINGNKVTALEFRCLFGIMKSLT